MRINSIVALGLLTACTAVWTAKAETPAELNRVEGDRVLLETPIRFKGQVLRPVLAGKEPVEALAIFLVANPGIARLEIQAHLADGDVKYSVDPGRSQARQIRDALVMAGVDPLRLEPRSYGQQRPIADPRRSESASINRRIELHILERGEPTARDPEAAEMVALSVGPPPGRGALCPAAAEGLEEAGADPATRAWVAYWLGPGRKWFARWRARCAIVVPLVAPHAERAGMPAQWPALMMIESGCNPQARSRLGALGLWQLMPGTARGLGLVVTSARDDRRRLYRATRAAGELLGRLHARFGTWDAALTAYNAGPGAVSAGTLGPEALNFVPKIRAAEFLDAHWERLTNCPGRYRH